MRKRFRPNTKVMIAIRGWGDTSRFSEGAKDEVSQTHYAMNIAAVLNNLGFNGVGEYLSTVTDTEKVD
jgi:chitinase